MPENGEKTTIHVGVISKKATLHVLHTFLYISSPLFYPTTSWNFQKLLSYTFYGGNVIHVLVHFFFHHHQGAKKIIFTACHLGKLKLAFTSPDFISTSPKSFLTSRIDFTVLLLFEFLKEHHLPVGQVKNRLH